ncbi:SAM dependent carboxyl methyltransferase [Musa troglodytarum]|uniref:SAM dependent carboxyl methyltransferase n=1 Tax=Musa troglodytarum TaxID=320322 RepID=A0A9E7H4K9_9LILI|nr:SAM dependent carboxyl methyltransferase [Musa troglodytarum]
MIPSEIAAASSSSASFYDICTYAAGIAGNVFAFGLFVSPMPTFKRIVQSKSTEEFSGLPYIYSLLNCLICMWYGLPCVSYGVILVATVNSVGAAIQLVYVTLFIRHANSARKLRMSALLAGVACVFAAIVFVSLEFFDHTTRQTFVGYLSVASLVSMFASPLSIISLVIRTKSVEFMPFYLSLATFLMSISFLAYGMLLHDFFIYLPNGIGTVLAVIQLLLYAYYSINSREDSNMPLLVSYPLGFFRSFQGSKKLIKSSNSASSLGYGNRKKSQFQGEKKKEDQEKFNVELATKRLAMASCQPPSTTELVTMDVESVLHMKGGLGETSYAQNSSLQKKSMEAIKHIIVDSATDVYASRAPGCFTIADLGCSSGTNAFSLVSKIVESIHEKARQSERLMPEILVFLNDLPTNDFNSVFLNFPEFTRKLKGGIELQEGSAPSVYLAALPGSFYGRLFPSNSLDFIYSCHSLHWLSEVPLGLVDGNGKPINKGKIYISNTSHPAVPLAYLRQFQKDFSLFLKSRSAELRSGGRIVVLILGRRTDDHSDKSATVLWELLDQSLAIMVSQEMVDEEKVDTYNVPFYAPSTKEIEDEVGREGSFEIDFIQAYELNTSTGDPHKDARITSMAIRAIQESMITHHFGEGIADTLFQIYSGLLRQLLFMYFPWKKLLNGIRMLNRGRRLKVKDTEAR